MSIRAFFNFDGVGAEVQGPTGEAAFAPKHGTGLLDTRNADIKTLLYVPTVPQYNAIGVTGLERHKVGVGADRRNALVIHRSSPTANITNGARIVLGTDMDARTNRSWRQIYGFTYVDFSDREPTLAYQMISLLRNGARVSLVTRRNNNTLLVGPEVFPFERGREYYIEVELFYDAPEKPAGSNAFSARVLIDQVEIYRWNLSLGMLPASGNVTAGIEVGFSDQSSNPFPLQVGIADLYVADYEGEAPYNAPLGPQKVMLKKAEVVDADAWTVTGAADAQAALADDSDASYIQSPLVDAEASVLFDLGLNQGSILNGIQIYARGSRGAGAMRSITSTIHVGSEELNPQTVTFPSATTARKLTTFLPSQTEQMAVLEGSTLSDLLIKIEA